MNPTPDLPQRAAMRSIWATLWKSTSPSLVKALYRRSGVQTRHSVVLDSSTGESPATQHFYSPSSEPDNRGPGTAERMQKYQADAPVIAELAVRRAFDQADIDPTVVTHLVTVSCSGFSAPGVDLHLIQALGLPPTVARTHVGFMGCHGALNGLRVARAFTNADPSAVVVICAIELCTLHHQYGWEPQEIVANSLFADGSAAIIGCHSGHPLAAKCDQSLPVLADNFSTIIAQTEHMMTWKIGDAGFRMTLSPEVPDVITEQLPGLLQTFLQRNGLTKSDVGGWAIHPGGPRILKACCDVAALSNKQIDPSTSVLARHGNMSSPTVLFIVEELLRRSVDLPFLMLGFGPGLNVEIALLKAFAEVT